MSIENLDYLYCQGCLNRQADGSCGVFNFADQDLIADFGTCEGRQEKLANPDLKVKPAPSVVLPETKGRSPLFGLFKRN